MHFLRFAGMPRRIPDYSDAFYVFNKIISWGRSPLFQLLFLYG